MGDPFNLGLTKGTECSLPGSLTFLTDGTAHSAFVFRIPLLVSTLVQSLIHLLPLSPEALTTAKYNQFSGS